jgi:hypothetical protein
MIAGRLGGDAVTREDFESWFAKPIETLVSNHENGFATLLLSCALIEAYARVKTGSKENSLGPNEWCKMELITGVTDRGLLEAFWGAFRHGLAHRALIQADKAYMGKMTHAFITHNTRKNPAIWWSSDDPDTREVGVDPEALAKDVLARWKNDDQALTSFQPALIRPLGG